MPSGKTKTRPPFDISDDNFFSAGSRTSSSEPCMTTNSFSADTFTSSSDVHQTTTGIIMDKTVFEFTSSGSNTQIVPSMLFYRHTGSNSYLGDSHGDHVLTAATCHLPHLCCSGVQGSRGGTTAGATFPTKRMQLRVICFHRVIPH